MKVQVNLSEEMVKKVDVNSTSLKYHKIHFIVNR